MTLLFFFSALGAFNGFLLSLYFAINAKKKNFTNYFLSLLLLVLSIRIIKSVFFYFTPHISNIFIQIGLSACIMIGPLLYLYLNSYSEKKANWKIHAIPYLVLMTALGIFYPYVEHQAIWSRWIVCGIYFQWFMYIILSFKYMLPIIQKFKKKENLKNLDVWFLSIYLGVLFIWLAYTIAAYTSYIVGALSFTFVLYLIVLLLIFRNSNESTSFFEEKEKYKNREIDKKTLQLIEQKFSLIVDKELFLNPNFTLEDAAKELKITKHILSQYVNEILGKSFSSLIREYRVEKAKQLLETETNYTIESLGYDSGFNSKSTFFTAFKKITGSTPAEYQRSQSK
ncbi:helix-turn-helix domain-containing protein [Chryseobacterium sp. LC2016-27]|uniref:helix-turn-helix domain-containing protein n=1 Tax=Chryseobacterium sp. LC2016-27 TaxID=2897326 RepID=UPI001E34A687|nr:helix-turn-helix domain-containing protein [Chryseobacterium sp. LC2016-27]MCD0455376.1 helix-turn-helix domain-containing protein [Chryseobacterium sp. LC2016-27]